MRRPSRGPDPWIVTGVVAVLILVAAVACVRVEGDACRDVGMSVLAAPAGTSRPAPRFTKAPPTWRPQVTKAPPTAAARPRGGWHVDLDPCD